MTVVQGEHLEVTEQQAGRQRLLAVLQQVPQGLQEPRPQGGEQETLPCHC